MQTDPGPLVWKLTTETRMARKQTKPPAKKAASKGAGKTAAKKPSKATGFNFGSNKPAKPVDPTKRYPKKIYDLQDLPVKHYKSFRNMVRELEDEADTLDKTILPPGGKLAVRIERSQSAGGKGVKYNSSRKIFDSFNQIASYLRGSNSLDRNNELISHIQIITFKNTYSSQAWQADLEIRRDKKRLKQSEKKERQLIRERAAREQYKIKSKEKDELIMSLTRQNRELKKTLAEKLTVERARQFPKAKRGAYKRRGTK